MTLQSQSKEENGSDSSLMPQRVSRSQNDWYFSAQCNTLVPLKSNLHTFPSSFRNKFFCIIGSHRPLFANSKRSLFSLCLVSHHTQSWWFESEVHLADPLTCFPCEPQKQIPTRLTPWTDVLPVLFLPVGTFSLWLLWSQDWNTAYTRVVVSF